MKEKLFEEPLQENYLVKEAVLHLHRFDLDFLVEQAKQKGHFSYETLVGVMDFLVEEKEMRHLIEYHHVSFTKKILDKMVQGSLDNWPAPELRRHYLRELDLKLDLYSKEEFVIEMELEKKRLEKSEEKPVGYLSLEDFQKELDKE